MKKVVAIALSLVALSLASENITITKEMADALGKNDITKLFLETGNTLVGATVSASRSSFTIRSDSNKDDRVTCTTQSYDADQRGFEYCETFVNGLKASSKKLNIDYIRKFYVDIVKIHRNVK